MRSHSEFEESYDDETRLGGEILSMPLGKLPRRPLLSLPDSTTVADAIKALNEKRVGAAIVTQGGRLAGIFTERDVLSKVAAKPLDPNTIRVSEVMTPNPETLPSEAKVAYALRKMSEEGYRHIPIVDGAGNVTGVVAVRDIVRWLVDLFPEAVNLPPDPTLEARSTDGG
jgi:CBS domain-containing protein